MKTAIMIMRCLGWGACWATITHQIATTALEFTPYGAGTLTIVAGSVAVLFVANGARE